MDYAEAQFRFLFFLPLSIENESFPKQKLALIRELLIRDLLVPDMGRNLNFYKNC